MLATPSYIDPVTDTGVSSDVSLEIKVPCIGIQGEYIHVDFTLIQGNRLAEVDLFLSDLHSPSTYPVATHVPVKRDDPVIVVIPLGISSGKYQFVATKVGDISVEYAHSNPITVHSSASGKRIKVPEHGHRGTSVSVEFDFPDGGPTKVDLFLWEQNLGENVLVAQGMHVEQSNPRALDIPLRVEPGEYQFIATTGEERTIYAGSSIITID